jgi:SAM-dependent methyltransferase
MLRRERANRRSTCVRNRADVGGIAATAPRRCAADLLPLLPPRPLRVLELGCGDGALYAQLRPHLAHYVGVDGSRAMLDRFRGAWPEARLVEADTARLPAFTDRFDAVIASATPPALLRGMLEAVRPLVRPGGVVVLANVADAHLRLHCYGGALRGDRAPRLGDLARAIVRHVILRRDDGIGAWYSRHALIRLAGCAGFRGETVSSAALEYGFHAVLRPFLAAAAFEAKPLEPGAPAADLRGALEGAGCVSDDAPRGARRDGP